MVKNIYLRLAGGLGNQLYQFSYAFYVMREYGYDYIVLDTSNFHKYNENWGFLLFDVIDVSKVNSFVRFGSSPVLDMRVPKIISKFGFLANSLGMYSDQNCNEITTNFHSRNNLFLDGYFEIFQNRNVYFHLISSLIRSDLKQNLSSNIIAVNIRGGELARLNISKSDDRYFYAKVISDLVATIPDPEFHLLTDDIIYARTLLKDVEVSFEEHQANSFDNFSFIYSTRYKILSRSTFSKWAGFLSKDQSGVFGLGKF